MPEGRPPVRSGLLDTDSEVSWTRVDQSGGMAPVTFASEFTLRLCRLARAAQLEGRLPVTARCETSSTTSVVSADQAEGSWPETPESPLTLR